MTIILCGYMGSGKSLIGKKIARETGVLFQDLDEEIEKKQHRSIAQIFSEKGEIYFRKVEMQTLASCIQNTEPKVLSLGGGTPCYGQNLKMIKEHPDTFLVYLKMSVDALTERLFLERAKRPLLRDMKDKATLNDYIRKHLFERQFYYMQSDLRVDCSTATPAAIVQQIIAAL